MLDWHEFMDRGHQRHLLREAQRRHLIRELRTASRKERSRLRDHSQKRSLPATTHQDSPCPDPVGL